MCNSVLFHIKVFVLLEIFTPVNSTYKKEICNSEGLSHFVAEERKKGERSFLFWVGFKR